MKSKKIALLVLASYIIMFLYGCEEAAKKPDVDAQRLASVNPPKEMPNMPVPYGGLVLSIESSAITADEIINPVQTKLTELARTDDYGQFIKTATPVVSGVLVQKIADIKLYQKAKAALPENVDDEIIDKVVEEEVQKFIARCGGNYSEVEKLLKKMGTNWQDFYKEQRRAILVQSFISEELKDEKPVTHSELLAYYNKIKNQYYEQKGQLTFRVIDIETSKLYEPNDPNASLEQKARELAAQISEKLKSGEDFSDLAKKYSHDYEAANGGLWKPVVPGTLTKPYDEIEMKVQAMNNGDVSEPFTAGGHTFIVKLESKTPDESKSFEQVQNEVEARMQFEKRKKTVDEMMNKIIAQVDLTYADQFVEYCLEKAYIDYRANLAKTEQE
ncbi:MAG: Foldase protein PrsA 3 precursor [Planctomycetes bacterium ADurb.Bin401]|nr:MAG: Foldase protein PrsA 3 precursor [Planctomycetes bacterium ADurb.Bin401]